MNGKQFLWLLLGVCFLLHLSSMSFGQAENSFSMRQVLELAEIGPARLEQLPETAEFEDSDWQLVLQVIARLTQFRELGSKLTTHSTLPESWLSADSDSLGEVFELEGKINSVEVVELSDELVLLSGKSQLFACQFSFANSSDAEQPTVKILSSKVPKAWLTKSDFDEPAVIRGVLLKTPNESGTRPAILATDHIAWYPTEGAPTGQILLARQRMDVALLDEVKHRQPFVKPSVSREGEAFYAAIQAMREAKSDELKTLAQENVVRVAKLWKARQPQLTKKHRALAGQLANAQDDGQQQQLRRDVRRAKTRRDLAITVSRQAKNSQSSVATMFLQPEREVGELFLFDGTARRAVWIAAEERADLAGYYEVEVYPIEARLLDNRPIVCCFSSLPEDFPTGDQIRQPVQIAGIFFKSWRYRSRELNQQEGKTEQPRQLYTPVLIGKEPRWLQQSNARGSQVAWWGGIAFLVALAATWMIMMGLSKRDQQARRALRPAANIDNEIIESNTGGSG